MSDKVRVYEIAEEAGASSSDVIAKAKDLSIELKSPQSAVSIEDAEEITNYIMTGKSSKLPVKAPVKVKKAVVAKVEEEKKEEIAATKVEAKEVDKKAVPKKTAISKPKAVETPASPTEKIEEVKKVAEVKEEVAKKTEDLNSDAPVIKKIIPKEEGLKLLKRQSQKLK